MPTSGGTAGRRAAGRAARGSRRPSSPCCCCAASPAGYEDRRLSVYLRFLPPTLIVGLSEELAEKAVRNDELVTLLKGVPHILAVPAAVRILAGGGIGAKAVAAVGPAL